MTKAELLRRLAPYADDVEVMILDGSNGGGVPRTLNLGPAPYRVSFDDEDACADCDGLAAVQVLVVGFGCY